MASKYIAIIACQQGGKTFYSRLLRGSNLGARDRVKRKPCQPLQPLPRDHLAAPQQTQGQAACPGRRHLRCRPLAHPTVPSRRLVSFDSASHCRRGSFPRFARIRDPVTVTPPQSAPSPPSEDHLRDQYDGSPAWCFRTRIGYLKGIACNHLRLKLSQPRIAPRALEVFDLRTTPTKQQQKALEMLKTISPNQFRKPQKSRTVGRPRESRWNSTP